MAWDDKVENTVDPRGELVTDRNQNSGVQEVDAGDDEARTLHVLYERYREWREAVRSRRRNITLGTRLMLLSAVYHSGHIFKGTVGHRECGWPSGSSTSDWNRRIVSHMNSWRSLRHCKLSCDQLNLGGDSFQDRD